MTGTGLAVKSKGMPRTSAYSTSKRPSSLGSYDWRRSARPITCSQRSCVPNARTPRTWVTVRASQPSVSIETETTHRIDPPRAPGLPTVFMTSRSRSWSDRCSACRRSPVRATISRRKRSISSAAASRKLLLRASPESSCSLSMSRVRGRARGLPCSSKLRKRARRPFTSDAEPSAFSRWNPEMKSWTSFEVDVLLHTTMKHGGTSMPAFAHSSNVFS